MNRLVGTVTLLLLGACSSAPRPAILSEVDAIRSNGRTTEARRLVPQADARAEKLREDAEVAWPKGHTASSEILAERAIAAYQDARELGRIVRSEQLLSITKANLHAGQVALQKLEAEQKRAAADAAGLEAQLRVEREAESIADFKLSTPDREQARLVAARTALSQARLLCVSAKLLRASLPATPEAASEPNAVDGTLAELDVLDTNLTAMKPAASKLAAPLREAIALRTRCQQRLTALRRPERVANPTSEKSDQLFLQLAQAGFAPSRDDRGVIITLASAFAGNGIERNAAEKLLDLGRLAKANDQTPLLVIVHSSKGEPRSADRQRADSAAAKLREAGADRLQIQAVGGRLPVARDSDLGAARRNERLEVVFVTTS